MDKDKVIDSRSSDEGRIVRRRRHCLGCNRGFTTYVRVEEVVKLIAKKDGSRVPYDQTKIISGVQKACYKRPITMQKITDLAGEIEEEIMQQAGQEIEAHLIGEIVMKKLRHLDKVAYIRFASVYHEFQQVDQFIEEAHDVMEHTEND
ncbi:MAG: transcriptional regulator NrdR [Phycisphaerae bacterium]|nr:transcriptional regulator NrdR [Phycisphaerae bacterium]